MRNRLKLEHSLGRVLVPYPLGIDNTTDAATKKIILNLWTANAFVLRQLRRRRAAMMQRDKAITLARHNRLQQQVRVPYTLRWAAA